MADNNEKAAILKIELDAGHPVTGAYDVDDTIALGQCNAVNVVRDQEYISVALMFDEVLKQTVEWEALNASDQQWVRDILNINQTLGVPTELNTPARDQLIAILGAQTQIGIGALVPETVSQMEVIGLGSSIQLGALQNARALP